MAKYQSFRQTPRLAQMINSVSILVLKEKNFGSFFTKLTFEAKKFFTVPVEWSWLPNSTLLYWAQSHGIQRYKDTKTILGPIPWDTKIQRKNKVGFSARSSGAWFPDLLGKDIHVSWGTWLGIVARTHYRECQLCMILICDHRHHCQILDPWWWMREAYVTPLWFNINCDHLVLLYQILTIVIVIIVILW